MFRCLYEFTYFAFSRVDFSFSSYTMHTYRRQVFVILGYRARICAYFEVFDYLDIQNGDTDIFIMI